MWLYRDEQLDPYIAVKAVADNWAQQLDIRDRFLEEARVLRRADSDHVVEVYDSGESADGTPYFVMTYADQGTVADLLRETGTTWDDIDSGDVDPAYREQITAAVAKLRIEFIRLGAMTPTINDQASRDCLGLNLDALSNG